MATRNAKIYTDHKRASSLTRALDRLRTDQNIRAYKLSSVETVLYGSAVNSNSGAKTAMLKCTRTAGKS